MDDLDELLGSLQPSAATKDAATNDAGPTASAFSIDDDFDALLDSISVPEQSPAAAAPRETAAERAAEPSAAPQWASLRDKEQQDFMAWLEGGDDKPAAAVTTRSTREEHKGAESPSFQVDMVVHSPVPSIAAKTPTSKDLSTLLESSFVDVEGLRGMCLQLGSIPKSLRAQVWSYLLSGQSQPDVQVDLWRFDSSKLQNSAALEADCEAAAQATLETFRDHEDFSLMTNLSNDLKDIISLYCVRKSLPYHPLYVSTLLPLLIPPCTMSRPQASLCLYALCSHLFPIIGLPPEASSLGLQKYQSWMRLLLAYHFPALAQHLDRVLPDWEQAAFESLMATPSHEEAQTTSDHTSAASDDNSPASNSSGNPACLAQVPIAWTCGFFTGSLPAAEQTALWDWAIVQGNKYASLYLTLALFGMYRESLLKLDGPQIGSWIAAITAGQDSWHLLHPLRSARDSHEPLSMQQFVKAWIASASWIRTHTPHSFQEALEGLEGWAAQAAAQAAQSTAPQPVEQRPTPAAKPDSKDLDASLNTLFQAFSKLSTFASASGASGTQASSKPQQPSALGLQQPAAVNKTSSAASSPSAQTRAAGRMCLWTTAQEVVAQLCTSSNRAKTAAAAAGPQTLDEATAEGLASRKDEFLSCNPINRLTTKVQATKLSDPQPAIRYFGIDCRPAKLLRYGRFATAFHFDPCNLDEPDAIASMLATLEPLKGAVHFCLIGSGEALIRQAWGGDAELLQRALSDARSQLNAMAMFLLKHHFPYVSVLQGGFSAAAKFIAQGKAARGLDTLVDANLSALGRAIGVPLSAPEPRNPPQSKDPFRDMFRLPQAPVNTTEILDDIGEKFKNTFASLKKLSVSSFAGAGVGQSPGVAARQPQAVQQQDMTPQERAQAANNTNPTFVIGGDDDDDDDDFLVGDDEPRRAPTPVDRELEDQPSTSISVAKTEAEKQFALAQHRLSGLQKADTIEITKDNFPGAILFPALKYKYVDEKEEEAIQAHRYLVVTPERLIVLDSGGGGVGSTARVKSNHHLTELLKMTFRKKDPDLVSIYYARGPGEPPRVNRYRISKKQEFVEVLQRNTAKFR